MTRQTPNLPTGQSDEGFDLSQIFIGRQQQLDLFEIYLKRWKKLILDFISDETPVKTAPAPDNKIQGLVVLLFGRGGFGKSTLLKHYRDMVLHDGWNLATSKIVDWSFAVEGKRSLFNPPRGQRLDAAEYFKVLCGQLALALDKEPKDFKVYQSAVKDVEKAKKEASNVLDSMQKDDRYGWLRGLTVEIITSAVSTYVPGTKAVVENKQVQDAASAVAKLTQEQIAQVYARLHNNLGNKLGDYLEPSLRLGLALGSDLRDIARNYLLLIFFDTYEEADEGDRLLRMIVEAAGVRVGWVIAGRDNLWAGSEQRERSVEVEYGYKEIVPSDRGLSINFNAGDVGAFTLSDIAEYFALLREKVPYQPPLPEVTADQAKRILDVTQGVPLAVKIAAGLYLETANLETVTEHVEGKRTIVDQMVRRYLLHTHTNMEERTRLYGLALLRRAEQPTAIAAALGLTPEQARTSYRSELSRLHRSYSFIFTEKELPALHQEVRYFLRLWLQEHRKEPEIIAINERLKEAHETALKHLEEQLQYSTLRERLQDDEWAGIYLDLAEQQFWLDPVEGVRYALPFMIAAAIYRRDINKDVSVIGEFFEQQIRQPYHEWWNWAIEGLIYTTSRNPLPKERGGLEALVKLADQRCPTFPQPIPDYRKELEAALRWRLGESYQGEDDNKALEWYEQALARLDKETELREASAEVCYEVGKRLYNEKKYIESIPYLKRAIELKPDYAWAYIVRGLAYAGLKEYQRAIADYDRAIKLDPDYALAYNNRGSTYRELKEYQRAFQDYDRAIELDPIDALAYNNRGQAYLWLKNVPQARDNYTQSYELVSTDVNAAWMAEWVGMSKQRPGMEEAVRLEAIAAIDPEHYVAYVCRGVALGVRGKVKEGLEEVEKAIPLEPHEWDAYFWKGMLLAYYYLRQPRLEEVMTMIEQSLAVGLPPQLLTPLYWFEKDIPDLFVEHARSLLLRYDI
jgi:tetratricopeptide (TPR) repeat protein